MAGVDVNIKKAVGKQPEFTANWAIVREWSEASRYEIMSQEKAAELIRAITDPQNGVIAWLNGNLPSIV